VLVCCIAVARDGDQLPKGWDEPIPEAIWPEALISAVRSDLGALASPRAIETLRRWKEEARASADPRIQREAKRLLNAIAKAMLAEEPPEPPTPHFEIDAISTNVAQDSSVQDAFTVDSIRTDTPPREPGRPEGILDRPPVGARPSSRMETSATPASDLLVDDDAIIKEENLDLVSQIERLNREIAEREMTSSPSEFADEDEKPTTLRKGGGFYRAARIDPFTDEDEKPTASIPIPEQMQRRDDETTSSGTGPELQRSLDETREIDKKERKRLKLKEPEPGDDDEVHEESAEERTVASND
jgi:hypothetical protein